MLREDRYPIGHRYIRLCSQVFNKCVQIVQLPHNNGTQYLLFRREMMIDRPLRHAACRDDILHRCHVVTLICEELASGYTDRFPGTLGFLSLIHTTSIPDRRSVLLYVPPSHPARQATEESGRPEQPHCHDLTKDPAPHPHCTLPHPHSRNANPCMPPRQNTHVTNSYSVIAPRVTLAYKKRAGATHRLLPPVPNARPAITSLTRSGSSALPSSSARRAGATRAGLRW